MTSPTTLTYSIWNKIIKTHKFKFITQSSQLQAITASCGGWLCIDLRRQECLGIRTNDIMVIDFY